MPQTNPANPLPDSENATPSAPPPAFASGPKPGQNKTAQSQGHSPATGSTSQPPEPDLVDRIFEYILAEPAMAQAVQAMARLRPSVASAEHALQQLKSAVRQEFNGERCYITAHPATERQEKVAQVLRLFNGRNATEVARRLQISRSSVYSYIKQARAGK